MAATTVACRLPAAGHFLFREGMLLNLLHAVLVLLAPVMLILCGKKNKSEKTGKSGEDAPTPSKLASKSKSQTRSVQVSSGRSGNEAAIVAPSQSRPASARLKSQKTESLPKTPAAESPTTAPPAALVGPRRVSSNVTKTVSQGSRIAPSGQGVADDGGYENLPEMTPDELAAVDRNSFV